MAFPDLFKLEKLKIEAYSDRARTAKVDSFEAMFNPTTLTQRHAISYASSRALGRSPALARYTHTRPTTLDLQLLLDGTGVDQIGLLTLFGKNKTVSDRIADFRRICYRANGDIHEPNYLKVVWGKFSRELGDDGFRGRLASLTVNYQSFDRDGSPLRAQLDVSIIADDDPAREAGANPFFSPDVTHSRTVRAGDTLPLLTREIYGSSRHVAEVARANGLDQFRSLEPGRELVFPPIAK